MQLRFHNFIHIDIILLSGQPNNGCLKKVKIVSFQFQIGLYMPGSEDCYTSAWGSTGKLLTSVKFALAY